MITIVTVWLCLITHVACDVLITVNNNGDNSSSCCVNGRCPCSSLSSALLYVSDNTVINITSESVTLHHIVGMGSDNLNNITITGNGATIMCNNTGGVYCESCSNITIMGITWQECGQNNLSFPVTRISVLDFYKVSNIHIEDCTFHNSSGCPVYLYNANGEISIHNTNFVANVFQVPYGGCGTINDQYCAGLYVTANSPIILEIDNSNFEGNGCPLSRSDCCHCSVVVDVFESSDELSVYTIKNTIFSNNFNGLCLNPNFPNGGISISDISVYNHLGIGVYIKISDFFQIAAFTALMSSATFMNNIGDLLIIALNPNLNLFISIKNFNFNNPPNSVTQFGLEVISVASMNYIAVSNSNFYNNHNRAVSITTYNLTECIFAMISFTNITVYNTTKLITTQNFLFNQGAGIYIVAENTFGSITFENVNFTSIHFPKQDEGALVITSQFTHCINSLFNPYTLSVELITCTFVNNTAQDHVVAFNIIVNENLVTPVNDKSAVNVTLSGCRFDYNTGGDSIVYVTVPTYKDLSQLEVLMLLDNSTFSNNKGTALYLIIPEFNLEGNIMFVNNSASNGAAVYMEVHSISFDDNAIVQFINNSAVQKGGAMYINLATDHCDVFKDISNTSNVSFVNNLAGIAGNSIYFSIPESCPISTDISNKSSLLYYPNKFNYSETFYTINSTIITSPFDVTLYPPAISIQNSSKDYSIQESKMLGEPIRIIASVFDYFNNVTQPVTFSINCKSCGNDYRLSTYQISVHDQSIYDLKILPAAAIDILNDTNISITFLSTLVSVYKSISVSLSVTLSSCRAGYLFNNTQRQCVCYPHPNLVHCTEQYVEIKIGYWVGYLTQQHYTSSICPNNYCSSENTETSPGYYSLHKKPDDQCNSHRTGVACGECKSGYTLAYDSPDCINTDKCSAGMTILVIVLTILYWIVIVAVLFGLMYFQFQISSGYAYGIIYYYSMVDILLVNDVSKEVFYLVSILSSFAKLTPQLFGQLCFVEELSGIDQQFIHYSHALAVLIILLIIVLVARYSARLTRFIGRCIIRVICLLLLLSYTSLASTSLQLLRPLTFNDVDEVRTYSSPDIKYFTGRHLVYAIVAILCEVIIVIGLPLFLLLESFLRRRVNLVRIKPLIDQFQGCYKDKYRWFAAYYLICRQVIILIVYVGNVNYYYMLYGLQTACVFIAMIHIWVQPYKSNFLNGQDGVILLILVLVVNLNLFTLFSFIPINYFSVVLVMLPLLLVCLISIQKLFDHFFKRKRQLFLYDPVGAYDENDNRNNERRLNVNEGVNYHSEFQDSLLDYSDD